MNLRKKLTQIPRDKLIEGRWYVGRGRNANVARWTRIKAEAGERFTFLTVGTTFAQGVVKDEGYYDATDGCFQPFALIDEGHTMESVGPGNEGWDKHYAKSIILPSPPEGGAKEWLKEEKREPRCHHIWMQICTEELADKSQRRYYHECPNCGYVKITTRRLVPK